MKAVLLILVGLSVSSRAAEVVECPKKSDGKPLISIGAFFDKETEIQGDRFEVRGGYRIELPLNVAWLVCEYGAIGGPQRWVQVTPPANVKRCTIRIHEVKSKPQDVKLTCE